MKKIFLLSSLCFIISSFGFTSEDTANANFLADQKIVTKQTTATGYRLDDKILRQEVIGMALKVKGVTLPENYTCKKYFADATKNDWICRAVELAADNGIISKSNTYANPGKSITRAEALAMVLFSGGFKKEDISKVTEGVFFDGYSEWQTEILNIAYWGGVIDVSKMDYALDYTVGGLEPARRYKFYPNRSATRAEVFAFAKNILNVKNGTDGYCEIDGIKVKEPCKISGDLAGDSIQYGDYIENDMSGYKGPECSIRYLQESIKGAPISGAPSYIQIYTAAGKRDAINMSYEGSNYLIPGQKGYYLLGGYADNCSKDITLSDVRTINNLDVFILYYRNIKPNANGGAIEWAYSMRSPAGVSLETFTSWYKNVETVTFRENTLKSLGNNTYEFLVDMTENGVKSAYKVKSKVNLEKFTIDNISSVKQ